MKRRQAPDDELRREYDLKILKGGVPGKYFLLLQPAQSLS